MFNIVTTTYKCDRNCITIKYVLLICSKKKKKKTMQQRKNTINLRKLLRIASETIATIRIIFSIKILRQFQVTRSLEKKKKNNK